MKTNKCITTVVLAAAMGIAACNNAEYEPLVGDGSEVVYISEASTSVTRDLVLDKDFVETQIQIRLAQPSNHDIRVKLALSQEVLDQTCKLLGNVYSIYPEEALTFPDEVTIQAGNIYSDPFIVKIDNTIDSEGESYALPFKIVSCEGAAISQSSSSFCFTITKEIGEVSVPVFGHESSGTTQFMPDSKWDETWPQATIEMWVMRNGFPTNNQHLFTAGSQDDGNDEVYARFGDVDYGTNYNYLQIKVYGAQQKFDTGDPREEGKGLESNKWYHFAMVFDNGNYKLYKNGVEVCNHNGGNSVLDTDQFILCNFSSRGRETAVCELRLWKTARTPDQIKQYMFVQPSYKDPNLILYAPMHEGSENDGTFHDVTGHGHDGPMGNKGSGASAITWTKVNLSSSNTSLQ